MARNRASAKSAGTRFETAQSEYLALWIDDRIERRTRNGSKDRGDISGVRTPHGHRVVIECKEYGGALKPATWTTEAEIERGNDDALVGMVMAKRRATTYPGDQWVIMTTDDFIAFATGERPWRIEDDDDGSAT